VDSKFKLFELGVDKPIAAPFDHLEVFSRVKGLIRKRQFGFSRETTFADGSEAIRLLFFVQAGFPRLGQVRE
jgi:DNA-binding response OmpR family regulator